MIQPNTFHLRQRMLLTSDVIDVPLSDYPFSANTNADANQHNTYENSERVWHDVVTGGPFLGPPVTFNGWDQEHEIATKRIIGGSEASPQPFHSMLLVKNGGGWRFAGCGGTLISNCHVLTAAHCAIDSIKSSGAVFVNAYRPYEENQGLPYHFTTIHNITSHPAFNKTTNQNDLAIIKMTDCINSTTNFTPAIPADPTIEIQTPLLANIMGFGKLSELGNMFSPVQALQIAQVPIIPNKNCSKYYGDNIKEDMFCGGFVDGGVDAWSVHG